MRLYWGTIVLMAIVALLGLLTASNAQVLRPLVSQATDYTTGASSRLDTDLGAGVDSNYSGLRVVCTSACYIDVASTNVLDATSSTGIYLPAAEPILLRMHGRKQVEVTAAGGTAGTINVMTFE